MGSGFVTDRAHVRTGEHRGTRTLRGRELPNPVTACGAEATGGDLGRTGAISEILDNGARLGEMCPACRARVEAATGARPMPHLRGKITGAQEVYLRRLLIEARGRCGDVPLDRHHLDGVTARFASFAIECLKAAKARGWTEAAL
jgi:hypothetical protein